MEHNTLEEPNFDFLNKKVNESSPTNEEARTGNIMHNFSQGVWNFSQQPPAATVEEILKDIKSNDNRASPLVGNDDSEAARLMRTRSTDNMSGTPGGALVGYDNVEATSLMPPMNTSNDVPEGTPNAPIVRYDNYYPATSMPQINMNTDMPGPPDGSHVGYNNFEAPPMMPPISANSGVPGTSNASLVGYGNFEPAPTMSSMRFNTSTTGRSSAPEVNSVNQNSALLNNGMTGPWSAPYYGRCITCSAVLMPGVNMTNALRGPWSAPYYGRCITCSAGLMPGSNMNNALQGPCAQNSGQSVSYPQTAFTSRGFNNQGLLQIKRPSGPYYPLYRQEAPNKSFNPMFVNNPYSLPQNMMASTNNKTSHSFDKIYHNLRGSQGLEQSPAHNTHTNETVNGNEGYENDGHDQQADDGDEEENIEEPVSESNKGIGKRMYEESSSEDGEGNEVEEVVQKNRRTKKNYNKVKKFNNRENTGMNREGGKERGQCVVRITLREILSEIEQDPASQMYQDRTNKILKKFDDTLQQLDDSVNNSQIDYQPVLIKMIEELRSIAYDLRQHKEKYLNMMEQIMLKLAAAVSAIQNKGGKRKMPDGDGNKKRRRIEKDGTSESDSDSGEGSE